jgi:hypothetical protein
VLGALTLGGGAPIDNEKRGAARLEAAPSDSAKAHSFARSGASTQSALACCCVCRRAFSNGSACYADQTKVKLKRFHLWRPAALDGVEAQTVPGFASLSATTKEAVRAWLQVPAEQWLRPEESERPWPMAITRVHPPPTDDSMDGSGATVRAIDAAATSAAPAPDAAAADDLMGMAHLPGSHLLGNGCASVTTTWTPRRAATASGRRSGRTQHGAA